MTGQAALSLLQLRVSRGKNTGEKFGHNESKEVVLVTVMLWWSSLLSLLCHVLMELLLHPRSQRPRRSGAVQLGRCSWLK